MAVFCFSATVCAFPNPFVLQNRRFRQIITKQALASLGASLSFITSRLTCFYSCRLGPNDRYRVDISVAKDAYFSRLALTDVRGKCAGVPLNSLSPQFCSCAKLCKDDSCCCQALLMIQSGQMRSSRNLLMSLVIRSLETFV